MLSDAHLADKDIMYGKQHVFDFRDRLGKNLVTVLAETPQKNLNTKMKMMDGTMSDPPHGKLISFAENYRPLCSMNTSSLEEFFLILRNTPTKLS